MVAMTATPVTASFLRMSFSPIVSGGTDVSHDSREHHRDACASRQADSRQPLTGGDTAATPTGDPITTGTKSVV
ncbi:hypothetical protein GCM10009629_23650 [Pseudonocardia alni]